MSYTNEFSCYGSKVNATRENQPVCKWPWYHGLVQMDLHQAELCISAT
jgi:hypothetical protein